MHLEISIPKFHILDTSPLETISAFARRFNTRTTIATTFPF